MALSIYLFGSVHPSRHMKGGGRGVAVCGGGLAFFHPWSSGLPTRVAYSDVDACIAYLTAQRRGKHSDLILDASDQGLETALLVPYRNSLCIFPWMC